MENREYGVPISKTIKTERKTVKMVLTNAQQMEALSDYLTRHFPEFRNMNIAFDYIVLNHEFEGMEFEDALVQATAFRERTTK